MGRTAQVLLYGTVYSIRTDLDDKVQGKDIASRLWDYLYAFYFVDDDGRLVYLYQPLCYGAKYIKEDIDRILKDPHPSIYEVFDRVDIVDEQTGEVYMELKNVNLIGILEGIKEVLKDSLR